MSPAPAPGDRETLLLRALERRRAGDVEGALVTLAALEQLQPRFSRLYQERGHCYAALQRPSEAIAAFLERRATSIRPCRQAGACSRVSTG